MTNWYLINGWQLNELKHSSNKIQFDILDFIEKHNHFGDAKTIVEVKDKFKKGN